MRKSLTRCPPLVLLLACALNAQVTSRIGGYVKDSSGAIIPSATVKAVSVEQKFTRTTQTDTTGYYELVAIPAATYEIDVESAGFQRQVQKGVELQANQNLRLDVQLTVGGVNTEMTVSSSATLVNTTSATLSAIVDARSVQDLPLNGRNIVNLAEILPGVTDISAPETMSNTRSGPIMSVNGSRQIDNNFMFNGANWTNFANSTGMNYPPPDAIAEVQIQTQQFDSQYGNSVGSQVVVTSKSGTNSLHGSAWEFLRNARLNARSFFQPVRPATHENQVGASAGGPIKKNKLFVFGYYQRLWNRPQASSTSATVPTPAQRSGDFTGLTTTLKDPLNAITGQPITDSSGRQCIQGKIILTGCLNPAAQNILNAYVPQSPTGKVFTLIPTPADEYSYMGRIDYIQNAKSTFNGHFFVDTYHATFANGTIQPFEIGARFTQTKDFSLSNTYTLTGALLNEITVDYMHSHSSDNPTEEAAPSTLGVNLPYGDGEGLGVSVSGYFSLSTATPLLQDYKNPHLRDTMTWVRGRHTMKWGYEGHRESFRLASYYQNRSSTFSGAYSGNALVDFELGVFDTITVNYGYAEANYVLYKHYLFFQDEFKISPRLTLTLGARYEPYFANKQKYGQYTVVDLANLTVVSKTHPDALPGTLFVGDPNTPQNGKLEYNDMNNIGPRVGFAWDVFGNGKTSIRGGYGLFYNQLSLNVAHQPQAPFAGTSILNDGNLSDPYGSLNTPPPPPGNLPGNFGCAKIGTFPGYKCAFPLPASEVMTEQHLVTPYTQSMSLTIERQIRRDLHVQLSYAGKLTAKLEGHRYWDAAVTEPDPRTGAAPTAQNVNDRVLYPQSMGLYATTNRILGNDYRANYQSVQVRADKRFSHGLSFLASYGFSKEVDDYVISGGGLTAGNDDPFNIRLDKGRGNFDHTHVFSMSWLWRQEHKFKNGLVNRVLDDWSIGAYHTVQSGSPINFGLGSDIALNGTTQAGLEHAQLASGMTYEDVGISHPNRNATIHAFFNTAAFVPLAQMQLGTYGNAGRNFMNGPALINSDFTLTRGIRIREQLKVQLRGEFFNAFNQVHLSAPNTTVGSGTFGQITSAGSPRVIQVAAKIVW
jgi:Carboxypeptidase regulatory-like domain